MKNTNLRISSIVIAMSFLFLSLNVLSAADGELMGLGSNSFGQLGKPAPGGRAVFEPRFVDRNVVNVAAGENHVLYLTEEGYLFAMGRNHCGQLGDGTFEDKVSPVFIAKDVKQIDAFGNNSVFVTNQDVLFGMGDNRYDQLGDPQNDDQRFTNHDVAYYSLAHMYMACEPVEIAQNVRKAAIGRSHTLFQTLEGELWGVGHNEGGNLALGYASVFARISLLAVKVKDFAAGDLASYYIDYDGNLWAAGSNNDGQLGVIGLRGGTQSEWNLVARKVVEVSAGIRFAAYVTSAGHLFGMGINDEGQVSQESFDATYSNQQGTSPVFIDEEVEGVSCGVRHLLYKRRGGELWALGNSELGIMRTFQNESHMRVHIADNVKSFAAGKDQTLFTTNGDLFTLGVNDYGQQGLGTYANFDIPVWMAPYITSFDCGGDFSVFVNKKAELWGIGNGYQGQLGPNAVKVNESPVRIIPSKEYPDLKVKHVVAGANITFFLTEQGQLFGMGANGSGQLGMGHTNPVMLPKMIAENVEGMSARDGHSMFWTSDGTLYAMGRNDDGQLGDGTTTDRFSPVQVAEKVKKASVGFDHSLYLSIDNKLFATGSNEYGQLAKEMQSVKRPVKVADKIQDILAGGQASYLLDNEQALRTAGMGSPEIRLMKENVLCMDSGPTDFYYVDVKNRLFRSFLGQEFELVSENTADVKAGYYHALYTLNKNEAIEEKLSVFTTVESQNTWPLDPHGILGDDVVFEVNGALPSGLSVEGKNLVGKIASNGVSSFTIIGRDSGDVMDTQFTVSVYASSRYPLFLGAKVNGNFVPAEDQNGSILVTIKGNEYNTIQLIHDRSPMETLVYQPDLAPFELLMGLEEFIPAFLSFNDYSGCITGIPEKWDYTTALGLIYTKIRYQDSRGEAIAYLTIRVE